MDERSSIVIAIGKYPSLTSEKGLPFSINDYRESLDYRKYDPDGGRFKSVLQSVINDNSNGVWYYLLLSAYIKMVGYNLLLLRMFSVILAGLNLYLIYMLAGRFQSRFFFQWTALIETAVNPIFSGDAILIRSYMLALLGCLLSIYFMEKIILRERASKVYFLLYFLSVLLAAGSHYFTFSLLAAEFIFIVLHGLRRSRPRAGFFIGSIFMLLCSGAWFFLLYPTGLRNMHFLQASNKLSSIGTGYQFTLKNLIIQWLNTPACSIGFLMERNRLDRMILKCFSGFLVLLVLIKLVKAGRSEQQNLLVVLTLLSFVFYSLQSALTGHLLNFIPYYLFFIIPLIILCINSLLSNVTQRKI